MTTIRTKRINETNAATVTHEWGAVDAKGRQIGLFISTRECDFVEATNLAFTSYRVPVGHAFAAKMQMTKDGKAWGSTQQEQYFSTDEERTAAIVKRLHAAMKKTGTL